MRETDLHHLFWTRANWNKQRLTKQIRDASISKVEMYVPAHRELHRHTEPIAPPGFEMSKKVLQIVQELPTHYSALENVQNLRDNLLEVDEDLSNHLDRQIPFIELSTRALKRRLL